MGQRQSAQDRTSRVLKENGIDPESLDNTHFLNLQNLSPAGLLKAIEAFHQTHPRGGEDPWDLVDFSSIELSKQGQSMHDEASRLNWSPTDDELVYRTVKRPKRDPISIELDQNESKAAKAAMG